MATAAGERRIREMSEMTGLPAKPAGLEQKRQIICKLLHTAVDVYTSLTQSATSSRGYAHTFVTMEQRGIGYTNIILVSFQI